MRILLRSNVKRQLISMICLTLGALLAALGIESFLLPNEFIDGGVTGISMLVARLTAVPLPILLVIVNAPFIVVGYRHVGKEFAIKSSLAIFGTALILASVPMPIATKDHLLGAVFGGVFIGAGVGIAIRGGGVLDGTEILAVVLSKRTFATVGEIILALNVVIFSVAAKFLGVESALYSVLTYFTAFKTIDYVLHGFEAYNGVLIVSSEHEIIRQAILNELGRGVTTFIAKGGYTDAHREVLFCVVTRLEVTRLEGIVRQKDPAAFLVILPVHEIIGGVVKKRVYH